MIEICCGSYQDGITAYKCGIKRIELNSALSLGGLTPSVSTLKLLKKETNLKIICMVRSRGAGFCFSNEEYKQMKQEAIDLLENGADGLAFGFLNEDHTINKTYTKEFVEFIHSYHREAVFHRAVDCSVINKSISILIELGVDRVLTSGGKQTAAEGQDVIKELVKDYGHSIEILPGSGLNASNVPSFVKETGVTQIHASCKDYKEDLTTTYNDVDFGYNKNKYEYVSEEHIKELMKVYQ